MLFGINSIELILVYDVLAFASSSVKVLFSASSALSLPLKDGKGYTEKLFVWSSQVAQSEPSMKSTRKYHVIKANSLSLSLWISWVCALLFKLWLKGSPCWLGNPLLGWTPHPSEGSMQPWESQTHPDSSSIIFPVFSPNHPLCPPEVFFISRLFFFLDIIEK